MTSKDVKFYYQQALKLLEHGEFRKTLEVLDSILNIDKKFFPAWNCRGVVLLELKEYEGALESFDQVIQLNVNDTLAWYNKGYVLQLLNRYEESLDSLDLFLARYTKKDDFYKFALYLQAQNYHELKDNEKALETLKKATNVDANFKEAQELRQTILKEISVNG